MVTILITGGNGQLGSELKKISGQFSGYNFLFTDMAELDISDPTATKEFIAANKPDWIINCAAYNAVDKAETDFEKALSINAGAVKNIVDSIYGTSTRFIHVSTDYVFDGNNHRPYNEENQPSPSTLYGQSKLQGEKEALKHQGCMVIRTSWLYSSFGSNFVKTIIAKAVETGKLNVVFDQIGTPTYAADLAEAIMSVVSGTIKNKFPFVSGLYHYSNEGVCSWYDFAKTIIDITGITCTVNPVLSANFNSIAKRPFYSVMDKSKIKDRYNLEIPHWVDSLKKCIPLIYNTINHERI
jgi:dTDP-4-dehydrorhamnose reductase